MVMELKNVEKQQQNGFLMPPHLLTNFEIQKYYQNKPRFNGAYSRDNLPKRSSVKYNSIDHSSAELKDDAYIINIDE